MTNKQLRELDAWIAEHVMGWINLEFYTPPFNEMEDAYEEEPFWRGHKGVRDLWMAVPHYTTDPAAAMMVLEKCLQKRENLELSHFVNKFYPHTTYLPRIESEAKTLPLAVCLFAKKRFSK